MYIYIYIERERKRSSSCCSSCQQLSAISYTACRGTLRLYKPSATLHIAHRAYYQEIGNRKFQECYCYIFNHSNCISAKTLTLI